MVEIPLIVTETLGVERRAFPLTRGVELPEGAVRTRDGQPLSARLVDPGGRAVPVQVRPLLSWPDGSVRWLLTDFQADLAPGERSRYTLTLGGESGLPHPAPLWIEEGERAVTVCTGALRFSVSRERFSLIEEAALGRRSPGSGGSPGFSPTVEVVRGGGGDARAVLRECFLEEDGGVPHGPGTRRRIYGLGGDCLASLASDDYRVTVEEAGPLRCVIRCDGKLEADIPAGHYGGYRPFHFTTRIHAYAGHSFLRVLHTLVFAFNPRETEVEEISLRIPFHAPGGRGYRIGMRRELSGPLGRGESWLVSQRSDRHCRADRRMGERSRMEAEDERSEGWVAIESGDAGLAAGLRRMAEEYPKALGIPPDGSGIDVYLWRDPDGARLSLRRGSEEVRWGQGEGIYSDGTGVAKTGELFLLFYPAGEADPGAAIRGLLTQPHAASEAPELAPDSGKGWSAPRSSRMMSGYMDWMTRHVELGRWYGFLNFGDARATWEAETGDWRFHGRWGWCNSEWDPRHAFWVQYRRTGDPRLFDLAEAFTRHSTDVDTCHWHPFRPYFVGGCYRHSVDHFGDEPCASHTFPDNWMDCYALTGDGRVLDVLKEAAEFFYRFRWTEDPRFSFSLRSTGNVLRGLVIAHEVTGEERFLRRAEALFETIARAQNSDGSWNKRYQISTPDRLPDQRPYGMATEGTTWAVEMGTAPPFTEAEFRELWGARWRGDRVLPDTEQRGYQTHYLMISLERFHRLTRRPDVAGVYLRGVDWFCGGPGERRLDAALPHAGCGILCRHLAYAWRLTRDPGYLEVGRGILRRMVEQQDWRDDPRFRGAIGMSPTDLSYHFFGVPALLAALRDAGMEE